MENKQFYTADIYIQNDSCGWLVAPYQIEKIMFKEHPYLDEENRIFDEDALMPFDTKKSATDYAKKLKHRYLKTYGFFAVKIITDFVDPRKEQKTEIFYK